MKKRKNIIFQRLYKGLAPLQERIQEFKKLIRIRTLKQSQKRLMIKIKIYFKPSKKSRHHKLRKRLENQLRHLRLISKLISLVRLSKSKRPLLSQFRKRLRNQSRKFSQLLMKSKRKLRKSVSLCLHKL